MFKKFQNNIFANVNKCLCDTEVYGIAFEANSPGSHLSNVCFFNT